MFILYLSHDFFAKYFTEHMYFKHKKYELKACHRKKGKRTLKKILLEKKMFLNL